MPTYFSKRHIQTQPSPNNSPTNVRGICLLSTWFSRHDLNLRTRTHHPRTQPCVRICIRVQTPLQSTVCLHMFIYVYHCLLVFICLQLYSCLFTYVYPCLLVFIYDYTFLCMFTPVYSCLHVYRCLPMFSTVYSCLPMITCH